MPITKAKKMEIVESLAERVVSSSAVVFVNFHGLSVAEATALRKSLRQEKVGLMVAKKTLIRRAFAEAKLAGEMPELVGEVALAYLAGAEDELLPARLVYEFEKKIKEHLKIIGGVFEGKYVDGNFVLGLATIPSRQVLYGKLVNLLNSPIWRFVMIINLKAQK